MMTNEEIYTIALGVVLEILAPGYVMGDKTINQNVIENFESIEKISHKKCVGLVKKYQQDVKEIPELFSEAKIVIQFLIDLSLEQYQNFLIDVKYNLITS